MKNYSSWQRERAAGWELRRFGGINNPDVGLLSHCNRARILTKLCILTVIAEHFGVFECMRVFIPVCMRGCVHRCIFFNVFSALISDLQYTWKTSYVITTEPVQFMTPPHSDCSFPKDWPDTHLLNLLIVRNDQSVIIIDLTHLSFSDSAAGTQATQILPFICVTALERTEKD